MAENITSFHSILLEFFELCLNIHKLETQNDLQVRELVSSEHYSIQDVDSLNLAFENEFDKFKDRGGFLLNQLFHFSEKENFYFFDCPLSVYKNHYKTRKQAFLEAHLDAREKDFIHVELNNLKHLNCKRILEFPLETMCKACSNIKKTQPGSDKLCTLLENGCGFMFLNNQTVLVNYSRLIPTSEPWKFSTTRKIVFLERRINKVNLKEQEKAKKKETKQKKLPELVPVKNDEDDLSINQSVLFLEELNLFAGKHFVKATKSAQAEVLSKLLRRNAKNIKEALVKLEKAPSKCGPGYAKDRDKIKKLISILE
jgi:hypothetical protein